VVEKNGGTREREKIFLRGGLKIMGLLRKVDGQNGTKSGDERKSPGYTTWKAAPIGREDRGTG